MTPGKSTQPFVGRRRATTMQNSRYLAIQCAIPECGLFQVASKTKSSKFTCKVCGHKQSIQRVLLNSESAKECRQLVQTKNAQKGERTEGGKATFFSLSVPKQQPQPVFNARGQRSAANYPVPTMGEVYGSPRSDLCGEEACRECGRVARDGSIDDGDGEFYCSHCWAMWDTRAQSGVGVSSTILDRPRRDSEVFCQEQSGQMGPRAWRGPSQRLSESSTSNERRTRVQNSRWSAYHDDNAAPDDDDSRGSKKPRLDW